MCCRQHGCFDKVEPFDFCMSTDECGLDPLQVDTFSYTDEYCETATACSPPSAK